MYHSIQNASNLLWKEFLKTKVKSSVLLFAYAITLIRLDKDGFLIDQFNSCEKEAIPGVEYICQYKVR